MKNHVTAKQMSLSEPTHVVCKEEKQEERKEKKRKGRRAHLYRPYSL
jgi:hypothetical protein